MTRTEAADIRAAQLVGKAVREDRYGYELEDSVPLPESRSTASKELLAMRRMGVGQSFFMDDFKAADRVRFHQCKEPGRKFAMRKVPGGWRCWRVE